MLEILCKGCGYSDHILDEPCPICLEYYCAFCWQENCMLFGCVNDEYYVCETCFENNECQGDICQKEKCDCYRKTEKSFKSL